MQSRLFIQWIVIGALAPGALAATYYVDYDAGSDANTGTSIHAPFQHCPDDPQASGTAAAVSLSGGDTVLFKGGTVYRGSIEVGASGTSGARIAYRGDGWGSEKAIIDGSDLLNNWTPCASPADAGGNPAYSNLYYTYIPDSINPFLLNLHELDPVSGEDGFLWISQMPNPDDFYFFNLRDSMHPVANSNLTLTSIVSPDFLDQTDSSHWDGASVLVWVNPNWTVRREIRQFIPAEDKIIFDTLDSNAIYPDGRDQYFAIYNSPYAIDTPGEYAVLPPDGLGMQKVILWPRNPTNLALRVSAAERITGFDVGPNSHVEIAGFEIRKFAGEGLRDGCGIRAYYNGTEMTDIVLRNNLITHNKHADKGYGGIYANNLRDSLIESNTVVRNPLHAGIFLAGSEDSIVRGNTIRYTGNTALRLYTCKRMQVLDNRIDHIYSTHANGLTLYLGCYDVLIANNTITDAASPITHQNSANLYFINNVTDGQNIYKNVNEWPVSSSGALEHGKIVYLNNTFANAASKASLNIGQDELNEYVVLNNILDGMSFNTSKTPLLALHDYNLFTGRLWSQVPQHGWVDGPNEIYTNAVLDTIFTDPDILDFHLATNSLAIDAGTDVSSYYPTATFPEYDFSLDADGQPRIGWDLGAYDAASTNPVPLSAIFHATPTSGVQPLTVTFTDSSTGTITNRLWNFGDGTTTSTTATTINHTYANGTYTVELIVSGPDGANTNAQTALINVIAPLTSATASNAVRKAKPADMADGAVRSNGLTGGTGQGDNTISVYEASNVLLSGMLVFVLPDLEGAAIYSANLSVHGITSLAHETYNSGIDLYAVRYQPETGNTSDTEILATDPELTATYSVTGNNGTGIMDGLFPPSTSASLDGTYETDDAADLALGNWIQAQYDAGAQAGDYIFLRLTADTRSAGTVFNRGWNITSADAASNQPELTLLLGTSGGGRPPPPVVTLDSGSFGGGQDVISWVPVQGSGYVYSVFFSTNLPEGFHPLATNLADSAQSITNTINAPSVFYQIQAQ